jgi:hypothetical protein
MTLDAADLDAIAQRVASLIPPTEIAVPLREAMRRCGFGTAPAFHLWARQVGLKSMRGARGRYSVDAIKAAVERATKQKR